MQRGQLFAIGEHYHLFNRGAHKGAIFKDPSDYQRFLLLLHLANNAKPIHISNLINFKYHGVTSDIFKEVTDKALVSILAYSLLPNHFHLVLRQEAEEGIERFMRKVGTGYSMYFNAKHEHSGVLCQGRYKSRLIDNEAYFRYIFSYVHLNPVELFQSDWKEVGIKNPSQTRMFLSSYKYSSYHDYHLGPRPEAAILSHHAKPDFLKEQNDLEDLLKWATLIQGRS